jgi:hypothetical protein
VSEQLAFDLTTKGSRDRVAIAKVLLIIRQRIGRENALSMHAIASATGVRPRDVQAIVKFLVEERSVAIGSAVSEPFGYYMIRSEQELRLNFQHFVRRGVSNLKHARAYNKASIVGPIVGQLEIEIGDKR